MKVKKIYVALALFVTASLAVSLYFWEETQGQNGSLVGVLKAEDVHSEEYGAVITRTKEGYVPSEVTIQKGQTVLFMNKSGQFHWPASDVHPTHRIYPEFDSKQPIAPDEAWVFTFDRVGEWKLHDHLHADVRSMITVTE